MTPITYMSEQPGDYAKALDAASTLAELRETVAAWNALAPDAVSRVAGMTNTDFERFRKGLRLERKGRFAGESFAEEFGDLLMPAIMFKVAMLASEYKVPFGLMYIRLKEMNKLPHA